MKVKLLIKIMIIRLKAKHMQTFINSIRKNNKSSYYTIYKS